MRRIAGRLLAAATWLLVALAAAADAPGAVAPAPIVATASTAAPEQQVLLLLQMPPPHYRADGAYAGAYGDGLGRGARRRVASQLADEHGLTLVTDWPMAVLGVDCYVLTVPPGQTPEQVALALAQDPRVAWAQPMGLFRAQAAHTDPLYALQPAAGAWHLSALHELATGRGVRVAVVDSGIEETHPDLAGQIDARENFVTARPFVAERHGTEVAGIIAARADNGVGIVGIAPRARLLALRACWQEADGVATRCTSLSLARALDFAITHDAAVINLSLAGPPDRLLGKLLDVALARGISVVGAVDRELRGGGFPATHPGVLAVLDAAPDGGVVAPAAAGPLADTAAPATEMLSAPGRDVPTTEPGARWGLVSGASYATAHVSGLVALLRELGTAGPARPAPAVVLVHLPGGAIDACASLARASAAWACDSAPTRSARSSAPP